MKEIVIKGSKAPLFIRLTLAVIFILTFLIPIAGAIATLMTKGPHIGILIAFLFCWLIDFYLLRIILWNTYGQELLYLNPEKLEYTADFKYFKDGKRELQRPTACELISVSDKDSSSQLWISDENEELQTVLTVPAEQLEEIRQEIISYYHLDRSE